jgi:hypothetical protein
VLLVVVAVVQVVPVAVLIATMAVVPEVPAAVMD